MGSRTAAAHALTHGSRASAGRPRKPEAQFKRREIEEMLPVSDDPRPSPINVVEAAPEGLSLRAQAAATHRPLDADGSARLVWP